MFELACHGTGRGTSRWTREASRQARHQTPSRPLGSYRLGEHLAAPRYGPSLARVFVRSLLWLFERPEEAMSGPASRTIESVFKKHRVRLPSCGIECGDGWAEIIDSLLADLIVMGWNRYVAQCKEKFGALRFYCGEGSTEIFARISKAERESAKFCETCGSTGSLRRYGHWLITLCDKHHAEHEVSRG